MTRNKRKIWVYFIDVVFVNGTTAQITLVRAAFYEGSECGR